MTGWSLFAISHVLLLAGYFLSGESNMTMRQLSAVTSWTWFGLFPLWGLSFASPIFTVVLWKRLDTKTKIYGVLYPGLIILASVASAFVVSLILGI